MCVIVYKPEGVEVPSLETLADCWAANPDGAGFMFPEGGKVSIRKGFMRWTEFATALSEATEGGDLTDAPAAFHFRIATHGKVKPGCCHPFPVKADYSAMRKTETRADVGFMHNGVLRGFATSDGVSDSMAFAKNVLQGPRAPRAALPGGSPAVKGGSEGAARSFFGKVPAGQFSEEVRALYGRKDRLAGCERQGSPTRKLEGGAFSLERAAAGQRRAVTHAPRRRARRSAGCTMRCRRCTPRP